MSDFLDFTRDDVYQRRQLLYVTQKLKLAEHQRKLVNSLAAKRVHAERVGTYQWMRGQIEAELDRRKTGAIDTSSSV